MLPEERKNPVTLHPDRKMADRGKKTVFYGRESFIAREKRATFWLFERGSERASAWGPSVCSTPRVVVDPGVR